MIQRPAGEQVLVPIYSSSAAGSSSSSSENGYSSISHVSEGDMKGFRTDHYDAEVAVDRKQHYKGLSCFRCGDISHAWRNCDVASGDESVKQRADQFSKIEKVSYKRHSERTRKDTRTMLFVGMYPEMT